MLTREFTGNTTRINLASHMVDIYWGNIYCKLHDSKLNNDEEQGIFTYRNTLQRQVKTCINNSLAKVNIIDPTKDNLTQPLSIKVILDKYNKQSLDDIEK